MSCFVQNSKIQFTIMYEKGKHQILTFKKLNQQIFDTYMKKRIIQIDDQLVN